MIICAIRQFLGTANSDKNKKIPWWFYRNGRQRQRFFGAASHAPIFLLSGVHPARSGLVQDGLGTLDRIRTTE